MNEGSISITSVGGNQDATTTLISLLSDGRVNVFWNVSSERIPVKVVTQLLVLNKSCIRDLFNINVIISIVGERMNK